MMPVVPSKDQIQGYDQGWREVRQYSQRFIRDTSQVSQSAIFLMGAVSALATTFFTALMRASGWTTLDLEMLIGSMFTERIGDGTWWLGFFIQLVLNSFVAFAYGFIFKSAHRSGAAVGIQLGLFHWLIAGFFMGLLPVIHPLIDETLLAPGFYLLSTNLATVITFFLVHMIYGGVFGWLFDRASLRPQIRRTITASY